MHQEHRLDTNKIKANGFIGRAFSRAELKDTLTAKPTQIYLVVVKEFLGYLDTKNLMTEISCSNPKTHEGYKVVVNIRKLLT